MINDVKKSFETIAAQDLAPLGDELKRKNLPPIPTTAALERDDDDRGVASAAALRCIATRGMSCDAPVVANEKD